MYATLFTDGGARGNPGPAGIGYVLTIMGKSPILYGEYIGETTNNQAEYSALTKGIERAVKEGVTELECFLDSELIVKQLQGKYRVKDRDLKTRYAAIKDLRGVFDTITFAHIPRAKNAQADKLVNEALDKQIKKPLQK